RRGGGPRELIECTLIDPSVAETGSSVAIAPERGTRPPLVQRHCDAGAWLRPQTRVPPQSRRGLRRAVPRDRPARRPARPERTSNRVSEPTHISLASFLDL